MINVDRSGVIDLAQFMEFFRRNYMYPDPRTVEAMINEFDGDSDNAINLEEFCQMVLPAASTGLRQMALDRRNSPYFRSYTPLPFDAISMITRLFDRELSFHRQRSDSWQMIARNSDFDRRLLFDAVARGYSSITMSDLTYFCERNGFYPRREDIESILRRLDHDANKMLSFDEFCEAVG